MKYAVTLYEKYSRYYPEEGGIYVEGTEVSGQLITNSLNEAKTELAETRAWFEEDGWNVSPIFKDGAIVGYNASNRYIGEGFLAILETGKDIGGAVSTPEDYC